MLVRIGKVTNVYREEGKVQVLYEDEGNASLPLPMLTMNREYAMPEVGEMVLTVHLNTGSSKGFAFGTYYGGGNSPKVSSGYRKDIEGGAYITCQNGEYLIHAEGIELDAKDITLKCNYSTVTVEEIIKRIERLEDVLDLPHTI